MSDSEGRVMTSADASGVACGPGTGRELRTPDGHAALSGLWIDDGHTLELTIERQRFVGMRFDCPGPPDCCASKVACFDCEGYATDCKRCGGTGLDPEQPEPGTFCWAVEFANAEPADLPEYYVGGELKVGPDHRIVYRSDGESLDWAMRSEVVDLLEPKPAGTGPEPKVEAVR